jgi:hypothetical protein
MVCALAGAAPSSPATLATAAKVATDFLKSNISNLAPYCAVFSARIEPLPRTVAVPDPPLTRRFSLGEAYGWVH